EKEKKKPKMNSFNTDNMVCDNIPPCQSQFAIQKLKAFEFVELWYFTPDGCASMSLENKSTSSSSYTFNEDTPGSLLLKSTTSCHPSSKALHDHDLSWKKFDLRKNNFLLHIAKMEWLAEHQASLTVFFMSIILHKSQTLPKGEEILLQYALHVHHE
ncbi:hypothetical protein PAXRUDRAFT_137627, partial [Paxillus rubicundulus Ve08.2h10]